FAVWDARLEPFRTTVRARDSPRLLSEGQVLRRRPVGRRGHWAVFPAVAALEGLRTIVQYLQVDLSAGHSAPIFFEFCAYGIAWRQTPAASPIYEWGVLPRPSRL